MAGHIYAIVHKGTGQRYIGATLHLEDRYTQHLDALRKGKHYNKALQQAWNEAGDPSMFELEVLEKVCSSRRFPRRERFWILDFQSAGIPVFNKVLPSAQKALGNGWYHCD
jgi:hypothetical protein